MSSPDENVARVEQGLEAFNRGDADALLDFFDEDIEIYSSPALANPGTYRGYAGYRQWLERWLDAWDGFEVHPQRFEPVGERHVVVDVRQTARGKGSGIDVEMRAGYMLELTESTTKALYLYPSWDEAMAEAERRESESPD